jgi:hypothetical protein
MMNKYISLQPTSLLSSPPYGFLNFALDDSENDDTLYIPYIPHKPCSDLQKTMTTTIITTTDTIVIETRYILKQSYTI